jgi:photosystem II stability/assembly factor-like uncharacterized protein
MKKVSTLFLSLFLIISFFNVEATNIKKVIQDKSTGRGYTEEGTWTLQNTGFATASRGINYISIVNSNVVYAAAYNGVTPTSYIAEFTYTVNGGTTWTPRTITGYTGGSWGPSMIFATSATTAYIPVFNATSGGGRILKTTDAGLTFTHQTTAAFAAPAGFPNVLHFFNENEGFTMGDPNGGFFEIYTTANGGTTWTRVPSDNIPVPVAADEYGVVGYYTAVGNTAWYTTNKSRVFKTTDKGATWTVLTTPITVGNQFKIVMKDALNGIIMDVISTSPIYYRTNDGGATWTPLTPVGNFFDGDYCFVPGTINSYVSTGSATGFTGCSYSNDNGSNWTDFNGTQNIQHLAVRFFDNTTGWAGGFNTSATVGGIYKFTGEVAPVPVEFTSFTANASQNAVNLAWETATEVNNFGFEVQRSFDNVSYSTISFVKGKGTTTEKQVYSFTDQVSLTSKTYYRLRQVDFDGRFEYSDIVEVDNTLPESFSLSQNFPNPFNPSTKIQFSLPQTSDVQLNIYDVRGNLVESLVSGMKSAGYHEVVWNAAKNASGIYFVQIKAGSFVKNIKMALLK